jgi:hypothetical protein
METETSAVPFVIAARSFFRRGRRTDAVVRGVHSIAGRLTESFGKYGLMVAAARSRALSWGRRSKADSNRARQPKRTMRATGRQSFFEPPSASAEKNVAAPTNELTRAEATEVAAHTGMNTDEVQMFIESGIPKRDLLKTVATKAVLRSQSRRRRSATNHEVPWDETTEVADGPAPGQREQLPLDDDLTVVDRPPKRPDADPMSLSELRRLVGQPVRA